MPPRNPVDAVARSLAWPPPAGSWRSVPGLKAKDLSDCRRILLCAATAPPSEMTNDLRTLGCLDAITTAITLLARRLGPLDDIGTAYLDSAKAALGSLRQNPAPGAVVPADLRTQHPRGVPVIPEPPPLGRVRQRFPRVTGAGGRFGPGFGKASGRLMLGRLVQISGSAPSGERSP